MSNRIFSQNGMTMKFRSEYFSYCQMKSRCLNHKHPQWSNYGGRGIKICSRWAKSFVLFIEDMGPKPSMGYSIERIDVNGNYEPANCKWATMGEQARNKRSSVLINYKGETLTLSEWAVKIGVNKQTIHERFKRGYTIEQALTRSPNNKKHLVKRKYKNKNNETVIG